MEFVPINFSGGLGPNIRHIVFHEGINQDVRLNILLSQPSPGHPKLDSLFLRYFIDMEHTVKLFTGVQGRRLTSLNRPSGWTAMAVSRIITSRTFKGSRVG